MRLYDRSPETEAQWERADLMFGGLMAVLAVMVAIAWVLRAYGIVVVPEPPTPTIYEEVIPSEPNDRTAVAPTITTTSVTGPVVTTTLPPAPTTTTTSTTTTTTTTTTRPWLPSDECDDVTGHTQEVMRWCPQVAFALQLHSRTIRPWEPGDLQWLMNIMACESRGDPLADNPRSWASGLFQGLEYLNGKPLHQQRSVRYFGAESDIWSTRPHIIIYVGLFMDEGWQHWPNCGRR